MAAAKARASVAARRLLPVGVALLALAACHAEVRPCETPPDFHLTVVAAPNVNPDGTGQSLATDIRILQLKDLSRLRGVQLMDVYQDAAGTLGPDLVHTLEPDLRVRPGEQLAKWLPRHRDAQHVVVVGIFHAKEPEAWHVSFPLQQVSRESCEAAKVPNGSRSPVVPKDDAFHVRLVGTRIESPGAQP